MVPSIHWITFYLLSQWPSNRQGLREFIIEMHVFFFQYFITYRVILNYAKSAKLVFSINVTVIFNGVYSSSANYLVD